MADRTVTPRILTFDSGLGGLTVHRRVVEALPHARMTYLADDAAFPYGRLPEAVLKQRVLAVLETAIARLAPDAVVIACNTASTLVLGPLRARWPRLPFVGTVPAIKPAAAATRTGALAVLATPGTIARDYTRQLVEDFAVQARVALVGSAYLAAMAEARLRGQGVDEGAIAAQIAPCFVAIEGRQVDVVALGCTHYPFLLDAFERLAPWPVTWIDPAPAIARRLVDILGVKARPARPPSASPGALAEGGEFWFASGVVAPSALAGLRFTPLQAPPMPFDRDDRAAHRSAPLLSAMALP